MRNFLVVQSRLERHYLRLIALAIILPTVIVGSCMYYVIFNLMAEQLGIPEVISYHLLPVVEKVNIVLIISLPVIFLVLFSIGRIIARNLVGPIERLENELELIIKNRSTERLRVRENDRLRRLVEDVNTLLERCRT
ncbi:MAG: methyl-accepting chemotaxis protein [Candidatus Omnitrophica bacterium]|nr:methyl-accepting chemotaxis protein [Candidatus Omnitrophota bacterium]